MAEEPLDLHLRITPVYNKWCKNKEEFISMLTDTLSHEMGVADLDGEVHSITEVEQLPKTNSDEHTTLQSN